MYAIMNVCKGDGMSEEKIKHLEFIQNSITRMSINSFQIKGWTVTIVSALLAVYASSNNRYLFLVGLFPVLVFWLLDTYYLTQERKFRGLYNDVAGISETPKPLKLFEIRPDLYKDGKYNFWNVFCSITILELYLPLVIILLGLFLCV